MSILAFKCLNHFYVENLCTPVALIHNRDKRAAMFKNQIPRTRTRLMDKSVICNLPLVWNTLPNDLKAIQTLPQFKSNVKRYLLELQLNEV